MCSICWLFILAFVCRFHNCAIYRIVANVCGVNVNSDSTVNYHSVTTFANFIFWFARFLVVMNFLFILVHMDVRTTPGSLLVVLRTSWNKKVVCKRVKSWWRQLFPVFLCFSVFAYCVSDVLMMFVYVFSMRHMCKQMEVRQKQVCLHWFPLSHSGA